MGGSLVRRLVTIASVGLLAVMVPAGMGEAAGSDRSLRAAIAGTLLQHTGETAVDRTRVTVTKRSGRTWAFGTTSLWNRLTDGSWISDAHLATGVNGPVAGWC
jgi:LasA protease